MIIGFFLWLNTIYQIKFKTNNDKTLKMIVPNILWGGEMYHKQNSNLCTLSVLGIRTSTKPHGHHARRPPTAANDCDCYKLPSQRLTGTLSSDIGVSSSSKDPRGEEGGGLLLNQRPEMSDHITDHWHTIIKK